MAKNITGQTIPVWLDCDPGHDDAFAILLAAYHPALHLLGISTTYGNASLDRTTDNALRVLEAIGRPEVPVIAGARKPYCRPAHFAPEIHGDSGLDGTDALPAAERSALKCNAIVDMYQALITCPPQTAWLITTGPLTTCALLLTTFPDLVGHLCGLSIMGGAVGADFTNANLGKPFTDASGERRDRIGNHTPYAEFNFWCDPESAQNVFSNPHLSKKTALIPLDLTHQVFVTQSALDLVLYGQAEEKPSRGDDSRPSRLRRMFSELLAFFGKRYADCHGFIEGPPLHDPVAVALLLAGPEREDARVKFDEREGERFKVDVEVGGEERGRTTIHPAPEGVRIPRGLDHDKFWQVLHDCVERAEERARV